MKKIMFGNSFMLFGIELLILAELEIMPIYVFWPAVILVLAGFIMAVIGYILRTIHRKNTQHLIFIKLKKGFTKQKVDIALAMKMFLLHPSHLKWSRIVMVKKMRHPEILRRFRLRGFWMNLTCLLQIFMNS